MNVIDLGNNRWEFNGDVTYAPNLNVAIERFIKGTTDNSEIGMLKQQQAMIRTGIKRGALCH